MILCVDTSAYSAFKRGNAAVVNLLESAESLVLPTIVLGELYAGFAAGTRERANLSELEELANSPGVEVAEVTEAVARRYAIIVATLRRQGVTIPTNDIWIAAVAMDSGSRVLTLDEHFSAIPNLLIEYPSEQ